MNDDTEGYEHDRRLIAEALASGASELRLGNTGANKIPPEITELSAIEKLILAGSSITDITPLKSLISLEYLDISSTGVSDISPLRDLFSLKHLFLWATQIKDIRPLARLTQLETLDLAYLGVNDLSPLLGLSKLCRINLKSSGVYDLRPLRNIVLPPKESGEAVYISQFDNLDAFIFDPELNNFDLGTHEGLEGLFSYLRSLDDNQYDLRLELWRSHRATPEEFISSQFPLAEQLVQSPQTGAFYVIPKEVSKPNLLRSTLGQLADAIEDVLRNPSNGLSASSLEIRKLNRMLERYANDPQRAEMDMTTVHGSLLVQIGSGELPQSNENQALLLALQEGAMGIRATDPDVAGNRLILQGRALKELSPAALKQLEEAAPILEAITEGDLQVQMREDLLFLTKEVPLRFPSLPGVTKADAMASGHDELSRVAGRSARIYQLLKKPNEWPHKLHDSAFFKAFRIGSALEQLSRFILWILSFIGV